MVSVGGSATVAAKLSGVVFVRSRGARVQTADVAGVATHAPRSPAITASDNNRERRRRGRLDALFRRRRCGRPLMGCAWKLKGAVGTAQEGIGLKKREINCSVRFMSESDFCRIVGLNPTTMKVS